jgi:hypothetical protein
MGDIAGRIRLLGVESRRAGILAIPCACEIRMRFSPARPNQSRI